MRVSRSAIGALIFKGLAVCLAFALLSPGASTPPRAAQLEPAKPAAPTEPGVSLEIRYWNIIKNSDVAGDFRTYLDAYPGGQFAAAARARLQQIENKGGGAPANANAPEVKPGAAAGNAPASAGLRDCPRCPQVMAIPAGAFAMGSVAVFAFEGPVHQVTIGKPFYIGQREVSFEEWDACVAEGACIYSPDDRGAGRASRPVTNVDWNDAQQYLAWLTKKTGQKYRLPSESEWEYAARAGSGASYPWGQTMEENRANCLGCNAQPNKAAVATGSYPANGFGLYDMAGNAAEWVEDCWNDSYKGAPADGSAWTRPRCQERVLRGGSFNNDPRYLRSAARFKYDFDVRFYTNGFRVARDS